MGQVPKLKDGVASIVSGLAYGLAGGLITGVLMSPVIPTSIRRLKSKYPEIYQRDLRISERSDVNLSETFQTAAFYAGAVVTRLGVSAASVYLIADDLLNGGSTTYGWLGISNLFDAGYELGRLCRKK